MKSYKHLYEKLISDENYESAIKSMIKGKTSKKKRKIMRIISAPNYKEHIIERLKDFHNDKHTPTEIYDGIQRKKRIIIVPTIDEQVIHHMVVNILKPIFMHGMYEHSYGSIPNRGGHKAKKRIEKWIRHDGKNCKYCLKMDIRKYFDSIPHDIFLRKMRKIIHDRRFMNIIDEITSVVPHGIPLGFYISQWTANWYLQDLDHYIKEELRATYYVRYMDDMIIFGGNKRKLHRMRNMIEEYLRNKLGLNLKENWQVFRFEYNGAYRFLDFMGFRFYRDRTTLRRTIYFKACRKAKRLYKSVKPTIFSIRQMLSYLGWLDCTNTYGAYLQYIKPYVNIQNMKRRLSRNDKKRRSYETCMG